MRITEAAQRLGTSPRMLRYRDALGLLPVVRDGRLHRPAPGQQASRTPGGRSSPGQPPAIPPPRRPAPHRQFGQPDLDAVALALAIERRYDITPAALAFGLRVLAEPAVRSEVAELGRRIGRIQAPAARALDFEQERALRLLRMSGRAKPAGRPAPPARRSG